MSPALPQPDPAPQLIRAPEPAEHATPGATPYVVPATAPARPNRAPIAIAGIIAGSIVALGVAAMLILPGGAQETTTADADPSPELAEPVAAAAPPHAPKPISVVVPMPPAQSPPDAETAREEAPEADAKPAPAHKPKKKPKKRPPTKKPPKESGDGFEDM